MYSKLGVLRIPVEVYAPFGTPSSQLTDDFLGSNQQIGILEKGRQRGSLRPEWAILVEILHEMERQPYAKSVGRKMFKWICYIMTSLGLDTGFGTTRRDSALLSIDVQEAIDILANHNWILEKRSGQGTVLVVGPAYVEDRIRFKDSIASFARKISMTVDLCSRIKSMSQAEQIATVISSVRVLKKTSKSMDVSEQDLFNYIRESGKPRMESEVEQCELVDTIRNLEMLGWVRLRFSESLEMARARTDSGEPVAGQHTIL